MNKDTLIFDSDGLMLYLLKQIVDMILHMPVDSLLQEETRKQIMDTLSFLNAYYPLHKVGF